MLPDLFWIAVFILVLIGDLVITLMYFLARKWGKVVLGIAMALVYLLIIANIAQVNGSRNAEIALVLLSLPPLLLFPKAELQQLPKEFFKGRRPIHDDGMDEEL